MLANQKIIENGNELFRIHDIGQNLALRSMT